MHESNSPKVLNDEGKDNENDKIELQDSTHIIYCIVSAKAEIFSTGTQGPFNNGAQKWALWGVRWGETR